MANNHTAVISHYDVNLSDAAAGIRIDQKEIIRRRKERSSYTLDTPKRCLLCNRRFAGNQKISICNSHSIPQFTLKQIQSGKLLGLNAFIGVPWLPNESGRRNAGTFHLVCTRCDSTYFKNYENISIYDDSFSDRNDLQIILNEIAMKNYLYTLSDHTSGMALKKQYLQRNENLPEEDRAYCEKDIRTEDAEIEDAKKSLRRTKEVRENLRKKKIEEYQLIYYKIFDRLFPIAFQSKVTVEFDPWGNHVNSLLELNKSTQDIHLCIFPLEDKTAVCAFSRKSDSRIAPMIKNINNIENDDDIVKALLAMGIASSGNFYISPHISEQTKSDPYLKQLAGETGEVVSVVSSEIPLDKERADDLAQQSVRNNGVTGAKKLIEEYDGIPDELLGL